MNDNTIISAISAIHRAIVSLFLFIVLVGSSIFFCLKGGLLVDHLDLPGLKVDKLYIKWDEKLSILAERVRIRPDGRKDAPSAALIDEAGYLAGFRYLSILQQNIHTVSIKNLQVGNLKGTLRYGCGEPGQLRLASDALELSAAFRCNDDYLLLDLEKGSALEHNTSVKATVVADLKEAELYAVAVPRFGSVDGLTLYLHGDSKALSFDAKADHPLKTVRPIVDIFGLSDDITQWIVKKPQYDQITFETLRGTLPYRRPADLLHTLYAEATCDNLGYSINPQLEPIYSEQTKLRFENGVLNIYPGDAAFYNQRTGESWLNIDLAAKKSVLNAFIKGDLQLTDNMLHLLEVYKIKLPFKQTGGTTATDLKLSVELIGAHTTARGTFEVDAGSFDYQGLNLDISRAKIALSNADVSIERLNARYGPRIDVDAVGYLNPLREYGHLNLTLNAARFGPRKNGFELDQEQPLKLDYIINSGDDQIILEPSRWRFDDRQVAFDAATLRFDFRSSTAKLKDIAFEIEDLTRGKASGRVDMARLLADIKIDLTGTHFGDLAGRERTLPLHLHYDDGLDLNLTAPSRWTIGSTEIALAPVSMEINATRTRLLPMTFAVGSDINGSLSFDLDHNTMTAEASVEDFNFAHPKTGLRYRNGGPVRALAHIQDDALYLGSEDLDAAFTYASGRWDLFFFSLERLADHAPLLQRFSLDRGHLQIGSADNDPGIIFAGTVEIPDYPALVHDGRPTGTYTVLGNYRDGLTRFSVNETVHVTVDDTVHIEANQTGFNLLALIRYINSRPPGEGDGALPLITLYATDGSIYFAPKRESIYDELSVTVEGSDVYGRMSHRKGLAILELKAKQLSLYGNGFGDDFMHELFPLGAYKDGEMSFNINGTVDNTHGVVHVTDTVVKDYKTLNNILAFINTVPALATFSLPHYSDKGLEVSDAYASFHYDGKIVTIDGVKVDSREVNMAGNGIIDYDNQKVDLKLNLITDAGENMSRIPVLGYILVGDEGDVTATLRIKGDLDNPKVTSDIAQNIVVSPFEMILRTVGLPIRLLTGNKNKKKAKEKEEKEKAEREKAEAEAMQRAAETNASASEANTTLPSVEENVTKDAEDANPADDRRDSNATQGR